jgi:hypothetical protein
MSDDVGPATVMSNRQSFATVSDERIKNLPSELAHHRDFPVVAEARKVAVCLGIVLKSMSDWDYP